MAAKKIDFKSLLSKLVLIFPKDVYIIRNWCAIAGNESDVENRGSYFCIFDSKVREMLNELFSNNPVIYIKSIRETKTDETKITEITDKDTISKLNEQIDSFTDKVKIDGTWHTFDFSDKEISDLFDEGKSLTIFKNREDTPSMIISKSIFPLITGKSINSVRYTCTKMEDDDVNQIVMVYDYDLFQFVMLYHYLKM